MPDYSLVPVDHQPDFYDASLVPVDHDPFSDEGVVQQAQAQQGQLQPTRPEPANPTQPPTGGYETGGAPSTNLVQDGAEPLPFSGFANPTPAESLVNQQKMTDHRKVADADRTGKSGAITDGGDPYELVTTETTQRHLTMDQSGTTFTATSPFYARQGSRYAIIEASPERPVTVTTNGDTFTLSRP